MAGRRHLITEDGNGNRREVPIDPANVEKQIAEQRAGGRAANVLDDDDLIRFGTMRPRS